MRRANLILPRSLRPVHFAKVLRDFIGVFEHSFERKSCVENKGACAYESLRNAGYQKSSLRASTKISSAALKAAERRLSRLCGR